MKLSIGLCLLLVGCSSEPRIIYVHDQAPPAPPSAAPTLPPAEPFIAPHPVETSVAPARSAAAPEAKKAPTTWKACDMNLTTIGQGGPLCNRELSVQSQEDCERGALTACQGDHQIWKQNGSPPMGRANMSATLCYPADNKKTTNTYICGFDAIHVMPQGKSNYDLRYAP